MVREDSWSVFERIRASLHMARADVICPARKNFELRVRETMKEREGGVGGWKGGGGGGGGGGTLHNECSLMNAAAPFLSRARFLVARLLTSFMVTRPNSRKIIYFVTTIFFKKKKRKEKAGYSLLYLLFIFTIYFERFKFPFCITSISKNCSFIFLSRGELIESNIGRVFIEIEVRGRGRKKICNE